MKIAITTSTFAQFSQEPLQLLSERGIKYVLNPHGRALTEEEAVGLLAGCVGVAAGTEPLTAALMDSLPGLKVISRCGTGMDNVDLAAAKAKGIIVRNTPDGPTQAVVELVLGMALNLVRRIGAMGADMRAGVWKKQMGNQLLGKQVGVVGYGRIGQAVGRAFCALGCPVAFYDPFVPTAPEGSGTLKMELDALLAWADIVTLHCPKTSDGLPLLSHDRLKTMKRGAFFINAARGGLVDEISLEAALASQHLAGAALDVFAKEPYTGPLATLPSVLLTPHIGSYAMEGRIQMEIDTIKNLLEELPGQVV